MYLSLKSIHICHTRINSESTLLLQKSFAPKHHICVPYRRLWQNVSFFFRTAALIWYFRGAENNMNL